MSHPDERRCPVTGFECLTCEADVTCALLVKIDRDNLPSGDQVPESLKRPGQMWTTQKKACYKCEHFNSNMPLTGRCGNIENSPVIVSADFARGDTCRDFRLRPDVVNVQQRKLEEV